MPACHFDHRRCEIRSVTQRGEEAVEERADLRQPDSRGENARAILIRVENRGVRVIKHDLIQVLCTECREVVVPRSLRSCERNRIAGSGHCHRPAGRSQPTVIIIIITARQPE